MLLFEGEKLKITRSIKVNERQQISKEKKQIEGTKGRNQG